MRVSPREDLFFAERRNGPNVAHAPVLGQPLRQRRAAGKTSQPLDQRVIDGAPRFARSTEDGTAVAAWPAPELLVMLVSPGQELLNGEWRQVQMIADTAFLCQQARQRRTAGKPST